MRRRHAYDVARELVHMMALGDYGERCIPTIETILGDWAKAWRAAPPPPAPDPVSAVLAVECPARCPKGVIGHACMGFTLFHSERIRAALTRRDVDVAGE